MAKRLAIYTRVSTDKQTTENQLAELQAWAERCGHQVVKVFEDAGISGAKGRDRRPGLDAMLKEVERRRVDMIAVWSSDRLGRSLKDLVGVLQTIQDAKCGLYIHTQALDTTTSSGRAMFGMLAVFAEFEREMIVERVNAGLARARAKGTRSGRAIGRPRNSRATDAEVRAELAKGTGVLKVAKMFGLGTGTVQKIKATSI